MGGGFGGKETQAGPVRLRRARWPRSKTGRAGQAAAWTATTTSWSPASATPSYRLRGRLRRRRAASRRSRSTMAARCGFSADLSGAGRRPRAVPRRQRLLPARRRASRSLPLQDQHAVQHRLPRLRRPAGHDRDRGHPRRDRPRARPRSARRAQAQLLRHRASATSRPTTRRSRTTSSTSSSPSWRQSATTRARRDAIARLQRRQPGAQARHRADAGQVRHLLHRHALQPGRRAGARLHRRQRAGEPRRHRDGPGPEHQGGAGRGRRARRRPRARADHRHRHQQGAQHLGHRRLDRHRPERQGGAGRGAHDQASAWPTSPPSTGRCRASRCVFAAEPGARSATRRSRFGELVGRPTSTASSCRSTGFYPTPKIH